MARDTTDVEAIFVDMDIIVPHIREVLYELRMNPSTGEVPIAIMAAEGRLDAAKKLAEEHQRVIAVPRLHSDEVLTTDVTKPTEAKPADEADAADEARAGNPARPAAKPSRLPPVLRHPPHGPPRPALSRRPKTCLAMSRTPNSNVTC
jgi:hypothetical protein